MQLEGAAGPSAAGVAGSRILESALANVLRRADASSAHIRVRTTAHSLDIEVTDDGRADADSVNGSLGIRGMSERAEALGGGLDVSPGDGGGWRVHAVLPLR
jgi:signal transduction histidine kinase